MNSSVAVFFHKFFHLILPWLYSPISIDVTSSQNSLSLSSTVAQHLHRHKVVNIREKITYDLQPQLQVLASCEYFTLPVVPQSKLYPHQKMRKFLIQCWQISLEIDHMWKRLAFPFYALFALTNTLRTRCICSSVCLCCSDSRLYLSRHELCGRWDICIVSLWDSKVRRWSLHQVPVWHQIMLVI